MLPPQTLDRFRRVLVKRAGGYLRNTVREPRVTCKVCATPVDGYPRCIPCQQHYSSGERLADRTGFLFYAVLGSQSGYMMRGYKAERPVEEHVGIVTLVTMLGVSLHAQCAAELVGAPATHWSTVPSLPAKPNQTQHPLRAIVAPVAPGIEVPLIAARNPVQPRALDGGNFATSVRLAEGSHVLLMDDTWTGGGHAQSAALALRAAGASFVSILVVARWLRLDWGDNEQFLRERLTVDYDPLICPWTGARCP